MKAGEVFERVAALALRRPWLTLAVTFVLGCVWGVRRPAARDERGDRDARRRGLRGVQGDGALPRGLRRRPGRGAGSPGRAPDGPHRATCRRCSSSRPASPAAPSSPPTCRAETRHPLPEVCERDRRARSGPGAVRARHLPLPVRRADRRGPAGPDGLGQRGCADRRAHGRQVRRPRGRVARRAAGRRQRPRRTPSSGSSRAPCSSWLCEFDITSQPRLDDTEFISRVVFDPAQEAGTPKERLTYLFPNRDASLITVRLRPDLTDDERADAIELFKRAAGDERFGLSDGDYVVSGVPAVVSGLADALRSELLLLLVVAVIVMAAVLAAILGPPLRCFRWRWRWRPPRSPSACFACSEAASRWPRSRWCRC